MEIPHHRVEFQARVGFYYQQQPLNYEALSSRDSLDSIGYSASQCCSSMSLYSFDSERDTAAFVQEDSGRRYNTQNTLYVLPSDQPEFARHDKQHRMLELALGNLYPAPDIVEAILAPKPQDVAILDLGAGSGAWSIAMAERFPHARIVGTDLVINASRPTPSNCRFEFDDINLGLSHFHGEFDLVHSRAVVNGIVDFTKYINDIVACLKPGGMAILVEGDWRPYQEDKRTPYPLAGVDGDEGSWWGRVCDEAFTLMKRRGSSIGGADEVENGIRHPLITNNETKAIFVPLGPWAVGVTPEETSSLIEQGQLMAENAQEFVKALSRLFEQTAGLDPEVTAHWIQQVETNLSSNTTREYVKYRYAWGIKVAPQALDG